MHTGQIKTNKWARKPRISVKFGLGTASPHSSGFARIAVPIALSLSPAHCLTIAIGGVGSRDLSVSTRPYSIRFFLFRSFIDRTSISLAYAIERRCATPVVYQHPPTPGLCRIGCNVATHDADLSQLTPIRRVTKPIEATRSR